MSQPSLPVNQALPIDADRAVLVGRAWRPDVAGPAVVTLRDGRIIDITSKQCPTVADVLNQDDPTAWTRNAVGEAIGEADALLANSDEAARNPKRPWLLAPVDLQAVKAAGVTFIASLLERVIEEQARGSTDKVAGIRADLERVIGSDLSKLKPGSRAAEAVKQTLIKRGVWSQYLEVGIGPDAEIFTKAQPMSAVGSGSWIGIHPESTWNNPEPEIALAVSSKGNIAGATLGNDVNLRDFEGRSALLLGRAKDNNASCSLGPLIRLFDAHFTLDHIRAAEVDLTVRGEDGFVLQGTSSMKKISRDPVDLVDAAMGKNHQYPDGFTLLLGTMFVPVQDRDAPGKGFTHKTGDIVSIHTPLLGTLCNAVRHCPDCPPWAFGISALMRNLAGRTLL